jgi:hypothetical protein
VVEIAAKIHEPYMQFPGHFTLQFPSLYETEDRILKGSVACRSVQVEVLEGRLNKISYGTM